MNKISDQESTGSLQLSDSRRRQLPGPHSIEDLPPPGTKRWVVRRKAEVVSGVRNGVLTLDEACTRYNLSVEEFLSWQSLIDRHGIRGLRATRLQKYRDRRFE